MKKVFSILLALVMCLSLLPTVAWAATTHTAASQEEFSGVCSKAVSGDTIILGNGEFAIGPVDINGKTLTFKGQGANSTKVYIGNGGYDGNGGHGSNKTANMTFEDLTLDDLASDAGYLTGFTEAAGLTFKNVTFNCGFSNWGNKGGDVSFYNCTFNQTNVDKYNVQELRSASNTHYLFDGCTFTSAGRFINAYKQGGKDVKVFVTVKDCTFNSTASKYAAVYLKNATGNENDGCSVELRFMGTNTVTGTYVTDSKTGSPLYGEKGTSDATVYVNDVLVWANSKAVSTNFVEDEKGVYHIKNLAGLLEFRDAVNAGTSYSGKTVVLDADIDMTSVTPWTPIGIDTSHSFQGTFDGQSHTISGLNAKLELTYGGGFFGNLVGSAAVKNVTFDNITIESTLKNDAGRIKGNVYGVVSGYAYGAVNFESITVSNSSVKAYGKVGAVLGMAAEPGESVTTFKNVTVSNTKVCGTYNCATLCGTLQNKISITDCSGTATWVPNALNNDSNWEKYGSVPGCAGTYAIKESSPYYCVAWADKYVKFYADDGKIGSELADGIPVCAAKIGSKSYTTFAEALAAANPGDTITMVQDVTLDHYVDVDKDLTIDGNGRTMTLKYKTPGANALFNHSGPTNEGVVNSLTVKDLTMKIADADNCGYAVVVGKGAADFAVSFDNCTFENMFCGVMANGCTGTVPPNVTISNSTFKNVKYGVSFYWADYVKSVSFTGNTMTGETAIQETFTDSDVTAPTVKVTDGAYSGDPTDYVATDYTATKIGSLWYVGKAAKVDLTTNTADKVDYVQSGTVAVIDINKDSAIQNTAPNKTVVLNVADSQCDTVVLADSTLEAVRTNKGAAAEKAEALTITTKDASVTFDNKAVNKLADDSNSNITLTVTKEEATVAEETVTNTEAYGKVVTDANKAKAVVVTLELMIDNQPAFTAENAANNGTATVKIPLPDGCNTAKLYWLKDDSTTEEITCTISGGYAVATLNHFSEYVLIGDTVHSGSGSYTPSAAQTITTDLPAGSITKVTVDGKVVDSKYYTISGGNVTLTDAYIKTLSNGKHTVAIENATHISKATITVNNAANAATVKSGKTGDAGILLYGALAVSSVLGMGWVGKKKIH